jgi:hypothetical protein
MAACRYLCTARVYPGDVSEPAVEGRRVRDWKDWSEDKPWREL